MVKDLATTYFCLMCFLLLNICRLYIKALSIGQKTMKWLSHFQILPFEMSPVVEAMLVKYQYLDTEWWEWASFLSLYMYTSQRVHTTHYWWTKGTELGVASLLTYHTALASWWPCHHNYGSGTFLKQELWYFNMHNMIFSGGQTHCWCRWHYKFSHCMWLTQIAQIQILTERTTLHVSGHHYSLQLLKISLHCTDGRDHLVQKSHEETSFKDNMGLFFCLYVPIVL